MNNTQEKLKNQKQIDFYQKKYYPINSISDYTEFVRQYGEPKLKIYNSWDNGKLIAVSRRVG